MPLKLFQAGLYTSPLNPEPHNNPSPNNAAQSSCISFVWSAHEPVEKVPFSKALLPLSHKHKIIISLIQISTIRCTIPRNNYHRILNKSIKKSRKNCPFEDYLLKSFIDGVISKSLFSGSNTRDRVEKFFASNGPISCHYMHLPKSLDLKHISKP